MSHKEVIGILTRPYEESSSFSEILEEYGIWSFIEPMLEIRPLKDVRQKVKPLKAEDFDGIILTSRHALLAVEEVCSHLKGLPVFVVGEETARLAEHEGFNIALARQDAAQLATALKQKFLRHRFLYFSGRNISHDFSNDLGRVTRIEVYRAEAPAALSPELVKGIKSKMFSFIVFFSARTAEIFEEMVARENLEQWLSGVDCFAFSPKIAKTIAGDKYKSIITPEVSHRQEMLKEILKVYSPTIN